MTPVKCQDTLYVQFTLIMLVDLALIIIIIFNNSSLISDKGKQMKEFGTKLELWLACFS